MNLLYISKLSGELWTGPNICVPEKIRAQSHIDNVLWYNLNHIKRPEWTINGLDCKNLSDYPTMRLRDIPKPFSNPDLVLIEEFYCYPFCILIKDIQNAKIPYIITPHSTMTRLAQKHKQIKKKLGNLLFFTKMAKKAAAIQFLTEEEKRESQVQWKTFGFVIPNGIILPEIKAFSKDHPNIVTSYIGRIELFQKGLDLLVKAVESNQLGLRNSSFSLNIYGPDRENGVHQLRKQIHMAQIEDLVSIHGPVIGVEKDFILRNTDVFILTSRFEGHPIGLLEALSYGVPCFVTEGTNMAKFIQEYDAGWCAENSSESITKGLVRMINEKQFFQTKGKNALRLSANYSWDEIAKCAHQKYEEILDVYFRR